MLLHLLLLALLSSIKLFNHLCIVIIIIYLLTIFFTAIADDILKLFCIVQQILFHIFLKCFHHMNLIKFLLLFLRLSLFSLRIHMTKSLLYFLPVLCILNICQFDNSLILQNFEDCIRAEINLIAFSKASKLLAYPIALVNQQELICAERT